MSFQWSIIAGYLYFEIAFVMILVLPIFSLKRWYQFFRSRLFAVICNNVAIYFYVFLGVLSLFLYDAFKDIRKYSTSSHPNRAHLGNEMKGYVKLFRAQRNFYITGFTMFLAFVIKRLVAMIIIEHEIEMRAQEIIKTAEDTVKLAITTVLANKFHKNSNNDNNKRKLAETDCLLNNQKLRVKELEEEVTEWREKIHEFQISNKIKASGDK